MRAIVPWKDAVSLLGSHFESLRPRALLNRWQQTQHSEQHIRWKWSWVGQSLLWKGHFGPRKSEQGPALNESFCLGDLCGAHGGRVLFGSKRPAGGHAWIAWLCPRQQTQHLCQLRLKTCWHNKHHCWSHWAEPWPKAGKQSHENSMYICVCVTYRFSKEQLGKPQRMQNK